MIKKLIPLWFALFIIVSCGPSPEQVATMTASAWTATPVPPTSTPTATPLPYGLSLTVTDSEANPIANAVIQVVDSDVEVLSDETGKASWSDFPVPNGTIRVTAQGYFASEQTLSLTRGQNDVSVTLERDPVGLLPSQACAPNETLLYVEDFQDEQAQGWPEINLHAQGWNIAEYPEEPGNLMAVSATEDQSFTWMQVGGEFENAVWRIRYRVDGNRWVAFNWMLGGNYELDGQHIDESRYQIVLRPDGSDLHRITMPVFNLTADLGSKVKLNEWHLVEIGGFQGQVDVILNGKNLMGYLDPKPIAAGSIGLEIFGPTVAPGTKVYFDNISVCGLSAPFTSLYTSP